MPRLIRRLRQDTAPVAAVSAIGTADEHMLVWFGRVCMSLMTQNTRLCEASQLAHIARACLLAVASRNERTSSKVIRPSL